MLILGYDYIVPLVSVICGLWVFVSKRKHLLNTLLSLEYMMLSIILFMSLHLTSLGHESYLLLFFFFFFLTACEGALGLALLFSVVRTHGNDCFSQYFFLFFIFFLFIYFFFFFFFIDIVSS